MPSLAIAVLMVSFSSVCLSYRTRRSGLAGFDDPYALSDAIQAIDRQRRRSSYGPQLQEELFDDDDSYFNPNDLSDIDEDYIRKLEYLEDRDEPQYYPGYNFDLTPLRSYPPSLGAFEEREYGPTKRNTYHPHRVAPSYKQLRDIFGDANIPRKRMAPPLVPELLDEENDIRLAEEDTRQLAHKMNKLIGGQAEKVTEKEVVEQTDGNPPEVIKDVKIEKANPDGTTKTLEEIFQGADTDASTAEDKEEPEKEEEENTESSSDLSETTGDNTASQTKTKRASSEPCSQEAAYIGELLTEIARLRQKLSILEAEQVLEDKENDLLADALVYSTLDQLGGGNEYVDDEYNDISKATETEELIQMLADDAEKDDEALDDIDDSVDEWLEPNALDTDEMAKRGSDAPGTQMQWYDGPVKLGSSGSQLFQEDDDDDADNFVVGETPINVPYPDELEEEDEAAEEEEEKEEEEEEAEREVLETAVAEVENEIEEENEEADKVDMLRDILKGLSRSELKELLTELQDAELAEEVGEKVIYTCPAVEELSENCAFADAIGIPIDADARNLCVRHQLCYTCGVDIGIPREGCDRGYKETVISECDGDSRCLQSAAAFLKLMEEYHSYSLYGQQQCSSPCVEGFIIGED